MQRGGGAGAPVGGPHLPREGAETPWPGLHTRPPSFNFLQGPSGTSPGAYAQGTGKGREITARTARGRPTRCDAEVSSAPMWGAEVRGAFTYGTGRARQWLDGVSPPPPRLLPVANTVQAFRPIPTAHTGTEQTPGSGTQDQGVWLLTGEMGRAPAGKDQRPGRHRAGCGAFSAPLMPRPEKACCAASLFTWTQQRGRQEDQRGSIIL